MTDELRTSKVEWGLDAAEQRAAVRERYSAIAGDEERSLNDYVVSATIEGEQPVPRINDRPENTSP